MRVILADDAVVIREGLARLLAEQGIDVTGQAGTAAELLRLVAADPPDVAVVDIRMPPTYTNEGLLAAQEIRRAYPAVGTMVLSQYVEVEYALKLVSGTSASVGYLLKDRIADVGEFVAALEPVAQGGTVVEPSLVSELVDAPAAHDPLATLTPREREVLALIAQGKTDRGIASRAVRDAQDGRDARSQHPRQARPPCGREREPARARSARMPEGQGQPRSARWRPRFSPTRAERAKLARFDDAHRGREPLRERPNPA